MFQRFGTEVTVIEMLPRIVPVEDEDISKELERNFRKQKIRVETGARAENIQKTGPRREAARSPRETANRRRSKPKSCWWRWAASPIPRTSAWKTPSVELDRGFIKVDEQPADRRAGRLRHRRRGGRHAATGARGHARGHDRGGAHGRQARHAHQQEPHSRLHLHGAGHRQRGADRGAGAGRRATRCKVGRFPFAGNSRATILGHHDGFVKVVAEERTARFWACTSSARRPSS